ncbi:hypothetical protein [Tritonibacter horizontis]|uniref:DUF4189 domain-containing protein n=1 Tax=Tritonibacter horizontis TaxID=1768241 RepID=A0A132BZM7_9RHOB|nr:hypothetical protein [Tritonibacter horizontis]KUP93809.1 hypothetical protein TRIHO_13010 [Tritonibacter horizontis]
MFKTLSLTAVTLGSALALSTPVLAQSEAEAPVIVKNPRILEIDASICDRERSNLANWAAKTDGYGSYAVPVYPAGVTLDCEKPAAVLPVGQSWGFDDQKAADIAAMQECTESLPDGFERCALIGRSYDQ